MWTGATFSTGSTRTSGRAGLRDRRLAGIMSVGSAIQVHFGARMLQNIRALLVYRGCGLGLAARRREKPGNLAQVTQFRHELCIYGARGSPRVNDF